MGRKRSRRTRRRRRRRRRRRSFPRRRCPCPRKQASTARSISSSRRLTRAYADVVEDGEGGCHPARKKCVLANYLFSTKAFIIAPPSSRAKRNVRVPRTRPIASHRGWPLIRPPWAAQRRGMPPRALHFLRTKMAPQAQCPLPPIPPFRLPRRGCCLRHRRSP